MTTEHGYTDEARKAVLPSFTKSQARTYPARQSRHCFHQDPLVLLGSTRAKSICEKRTVCWRRSKAIAPSPNYPKVPPSPQALKPRL